MRVLVACLNANGLGGSEMYHYELVRELHNQGVDATLFTLREIDYNDQVRKKMQEMGIVQVDLTTIDTCRNFDIIVASQPQVNSYLIGKFTKVPIISIIHSEIRSEDPIIHPNIKHYIVIRESIGNLLKRHYNIPEDKISLIYNPIDTTRYNTENVQKLNKTSGIFIGGATDSIRFNAVSHIANHCIENDWDLYIMSSPHQRYDFGNSNIKYVDPCWNNEHLVKQMDFTAGILLGRTTLEGVHCGVPGYMYNIDTQGAITDIEVLYPDTPLIQLTDSKYVINQHLQLYKRVLNENII